MIERVGFFDPFAVERCITEGIGLLIPSSWESLSLQLSCVSLDWQHEVAYGLDVSKAASEATRKFADFVAKILPA